MTAAAACTVNGCTTPATLRHPHYGAACHEHAQELDTWGDRWETLGEQSPPTVPLVNPTPPPADPRGDLLRDAEQLVNGDRNADYGPPTQDFKRSAEMIAGYLETPIQPHDVAVIVAIIKMSRIRWSPNKRDSWLDIAGYAACGWDCAKDLGPDRRDL